jgi:hypothetical protein
MWFSVRMSAIFMAHLNTHIMVKHKKYEFKMTFKDGRSMIIEADDEKSARTGFLRRRKSYHLSYASVYSGIITNQGMTKERALTVGNTDLLDLIKDQTQQQKQEYMDRVTQYSLDTFNTAVTQHSYTDEQWDKLFNVSPERGCDKETTQYYHRTIVRRNSRRREVESIVKVGYDELLKDELSKAETHYNYCCLKLAMRIKDKGMKAKNIKVLNAKVKNNLESTFTDGEQTVRAWTIIASGPIKRPHYRYLIK